MGTSEAGEGRGWSWEGAARANILSGDRGLPRLNFRGQKKSEVGGKENAGPSCPELRRAHEGLCVLTRMQWKSMEGSQQGVNRIQPTCEKVTQAALH